jgi:hypothetical protein
MSLAVLKKKAHASNPRIANISGEKAAPHGFSLNGGYRNIGGVGRFSLIGSTTRTRFRGTEPVGHGGHAGKYPVTIYNSGTCSANDSSIIKRSSKNNAGMIDTKYKWIHGGAYPRHWVKTNLVSGLPSNTQSEYLRKLTNAAGAFKQNTAYSKCNTTKTGPVTQPATTANCKCVYYIGRTKIGFRPTTKFQKSAVSQGEYITAGGVARVNCLPTPKNKAHFPMYMVHNGCDVVFHTIEEARAAGAY